MLFQNPTTVIFDVSRFFNCFIIILFASTVFIACSDSGTGPNTEDGGNKEEVQTYTVSVSSNPSGGGMVSPSDTTVEEGQQVNFEAEPDSSHSFTYWDGDVDSTSENPISITVDQNYSITANFKTKSYDLTVKTVGDGSVSEEIIQQKTTDYRHGTVVELKAKPATAYKFIEWTGDLNSTDNPKSIVVDKPKTVTANFSVKDDKAAFKINVDWNSIQSANKFKSNSSNSPSTTHFGARLVYPKQNAVFAQSVEKITADSVGVITMEVPPADSARLLVAAVKYDGSNNKLLKMGVLEDLSIEKGRSYEWKVNDLKWTDPFWQPADSLASEYESGTFVVDKNKEKFEFYFLVRDPYYPKSDPPLSSYLIRLNGYGGSSDYQDGFRIMRQVAENPNVGTANEKVYDSFYPYLKADLFQLPTEGSRYVVYKKGSFTIKWE